MRDDELRRLLRHVEDDVADQVTLSADGIRGMAGRIRRRRIRATMTVGALGVVLAASVGVGVGVGNWGAEPNPPAVPGQPTTTVPSTTTPQDKATKPATPDGPARKGTEKGEKSATQKHGNTKTPAAQQPDPERSPHQSSESQQHTTEPPIEPQLPVAKPAAEGDVDGDGTPDQISVDGSTVVVQASTAGAMSVAVPSELPVEVVGRTDVDGDGYADVWVKTDQVGLMSVVTLLHSTGKTLTIAPLALPYGGGVEAYHLLSCDQQGAIYGWSGTSADATTWTGTTTSYTSDGASTSEEPTSGPKPTLTGIVGCGIALPTPPEDLSPVTAPAADGDVDGDGQLDTVTSEDGLLVVQGTQAGGITAEIAGTPLGAHDVDRDGYAEVFVDAGATVETLRFDGRDLLPFASLRVAENASYVCRDDAILAAERQADGTVEERTIRVTGTEPRTLSVTVAEFDAT